MSIISHNLLWRRSTITLLFYIEQMPKMAPITRCQCMTQPLTSWATLMFWSMVWLLMNSPILISIRIGIKIIVICLIILKVSMLSFSMSLESIFFFVVYIYHCIQFVNKFVSFMSRWQVRETLSYMLIALFIRFL